MYSVRITEPEDSRVHCEEVDGSSVILVKLLSYYVFSFCGEMGCTHNLVVILTKISDPQRSVH